jgi:hypothetical protein
VSLGRSRGGHVIEPALSGTGAHDEGRKRDRGFLGQRGFVDPHIINGQRLSLIILK